MRAPRWQFLVGAGIAALLLWLSLRGVDLGQIAESLAQANYGLLLVSCLLTLVAFYIRAVRWGVLLRTIKDIPHGSLFSATMIG